jgi:hypothetical protein
VEFTAGGIYCVHLDPVKILMCLGGDQKRDRCRSFGEVGISRRDLGKGAGWKQLGVWWVLGADLKKGW